MTVYIDILFLLNFFINYLLLLAAAHIAGYPFKRLRLLLGALLGAAYAVAVFFPNMAFMYSAAGKVLSGGVMAFIAFGGRAPAIFVRRFLLFFLVSFVFGGGVYAISFATGTELMDMRNGSYYREISLPVLLFSVAAIYGIVTLFFKGIGKHREGGRKTSKVAVGLAGKIAEFTALVDTGNTLRDPITNSPVLVCELECVRTLLPARILPLLTPESLARPAALLENLSLLGEERFFRLIPYHALGQENGLLLAFRPDSVKVDGREQAASLVGISPGRLSAGAGYSGLVGV